MKSNAKSRRNSPVPGIVVILAHHLSHPCGAGVVDRSGPEGAHADAAVIHRMRHHIPVVDPDKVLCILPQHRQPGPDQPEHRFEILEQPRPVRGPVAHLHIDVEMIVAGPGRQFMILDPGSLQTGGHPVGRGHRLEAEKSQIVALLHHLVAAVERGYPFPEALPVFPVLLFQSRPAGQRLRGNGFAAAEETEHAIFAPVKVQSVGRIGRHRLNETVFFADRFRKGDLLQNRREVVGWNGPNRLNAGGAEREHPLLLHGDAYFKTVSAIPERHGQEPVLQLQLHALQLPVQRDDDPSERDQRGPFRHSRLGFRIRPEQLLHPGPVAGLQRGANRRIVLLCRPGHPPR